MNKVLNSAAIILVGLALASCTSTTSSASSSRTGLPSTISETVISETIISETVISETIISETVIEEETSSEVNPLRKAYLDSLETRQSGFEDYETNDLIPLVDLKVVVPNTVQKGSGSFYYDMLDFKDDDLTFVSLVINVVNEGVALQDGWITARMGYGLEKTYHYDFITSIGADWFNGSYTYWQNPSQVNAFSGGTVTSSLGETYIHFTLAWNDNGTVKFLNIGSYSVFVEAA